jgi:hypothetical protein
MRRASSSIACTMHLSSQGNILAQGLGHSLVSARQGLKCSSINPALGPVSGFSMICYNFRAAAGGCLLCTWRFEQDRPACCACESTEQDNVCTVAGAEKKLHLVNGRMCHSTSTFACSGIEIPYWFPRCMKLFDVPSRSQGSFHQRALLNLHCVPWQVSGRSAFTLSNHPYREC